MYRLLVTDIDGTLLNSAKEITEPTKKAFMILWTKALNSL